MPKVLRDLNNGEAVLSAADVRKHFAGRSTVVAASTTEQILRRDPRGRGKLRRQIINR
jgi:hypothetical protein